MGEHIQYLGNPPLFPERRNHDFVLQIFSKLQVGDACRLLLKTPNFRSLYKEDQCIQQELRINRLGVYTENFEKVRGDILPCWNLGREPGWSPYRLAWSPSGRFKQDVSMLQLL